MSTAHLQVQFSKTAENIFNDMPHLKGPMANAVQAALSSFGDPTGALVQAGMFLKEHVSELDLGTGGFNAGHGFLQQTNGQAADIKAAEAAAASALPTK